MAKSSEVGSEKPNRISSRPISMGFLPLPHTSTAESGGATHAVTVSSNAQRRKPAEKALSDLDQSGRRRRRTRGGLRMVDRHTWG